MKACHPNVNVLTSLASQFLTMSSSRALIHNEFGEDDFKSQFEKGEQFGGGGCKNRCSYRSISINCVRNDNLQAILDNYRQARGSDLLVALSRELETFRYHVKMRFESECGRVWEYPESQREVGHMNFFKADHFSMAHIKFEILSL